MPKRLFLRVAKRLIVVRRLFLATTIFFIVSILLSGCLYPGRDLPSTENISEDLERVQKAVDLYVEETLTPPVREATWDAEKKITGVPVDFSLLIGRYLVDAPKSAYERGGRYQYVLLADDETFIVRLVDLTLSQSVMDVQQKVYAYQQRTGRLPLGEPIIHLAPIGGAGTEDAAVYALDTSALGEAVKSPQSPYSSYRLPLLITARGRVYLDYALDLALMKERAGADDASVLQGKIDARWLLIHHAPFVPALSLPYRFEEDEPVIVRE